MRELLRDLSSLDVMDHFYLAGGTSVALRLGHRRSIDLDFFSHSEPIDDALRTRIKTWFARHDARTIEDVDGNLVLQLPDDLHVAFLSYGNPLIEPADQVERVAIASLTDVGLMKLDAVVSRGGRKDFIDLFFISERIALDTLLRRASEKYPYARDFELMAVASFVLFDNADPDHQPDMLIDTGWDDVKAFFVSEAQRLGAEWFRESDEP